MVLRKKSQFLCKFRLKFTLLKLDSIFVMQNVCPENRIFFTLDSDKTVVDISDRVIKSECDRELELVCMNGSREGTLDLT